MVNSKQMIFRIICFLYDCCFFLPPQGSSTKDYFLQRTMQSLERYFYLIVFNAYLHQQVLFHFQLGPLRFLLPTVSLRSLTLRRVRAVSAGLRHQLQPVDVLPCMDLPVTGAHEPVRVVGTGRAGHQRSPRPGEKLIEKTVNRQHFDLRAFF